VETLFDIHKYFGYVGIVLNAVVGLYALAAWRWKQLRGRPLWIATIVAEVSILLQVLIGTIMVAGDEVYRETVPRFHMFYGFLIFVTVGLLYQYRDQMKGRQELLYGLGGLFIMGLGIRAVLQVLA
jgi:heme A synthase